MQKMITFTLLTLCLTVAACTDEKVVPQKSPCAALDNGPCGPKRPVNGKTYNTVELMLAGGAAS